ncbi:MAG TPA: hypothetical protein DIC34_03165 [Treponema sp.]|nr:hypothetical protein [Treponema sp.]
MPEASRSDCRQPFRVISFPAMEPIVGPIVGINLPRSADPEKIGKDLRAIRDNGFDLAEVSLDMCPLIIDGELCRPWVSRLKGLLAEVPLRYSAHIGRGLDLRDTGRLEKHRRVLRASIDICKELDLNPLVLHYEVRSRDLAVEETFYRELAEAADYAGERGVRLVLENIEVELVDPVIELVDRIASPNLKLNFDTGHAFLASKYFNFDFMAAFRKSLPYLGHIHLSDNTGVFEELRITDRPVYDSMPMGYRFEYGRGDIHLPPYFGKIPYDEIFALMGEYRGYYLCEYNSACFLPFNAEVQAKVRRRIRELQAPR